MSAPLYAVAAEAAAHLGHARRPARTAGLMGLPWLPAFCASDCLCADADHLTWTLAQGLAGGDAPEALLLSVEPRRVTLLRPTGNASSPLTHEIAACSELPRRSCRISRTGVTALTPQSPAEPVAALALLIWLAVERLPPWPSACSSQGCGEVAVGLAARTAGAAALRRDGLTGARLAVARTRLATWVHAARAGAAFLADVAGGRREAWRVRLRYAAEWLSGELDECLVPIAELLSQRRCVGAAQAAAEMMDRAAAMHNGFVECLTAGVVRLLELPGASGQALEGDWAAPLSPMGRSELVYLCRAGAPTLRVLAALRLMDDEHPAVEAALRQMLYSPLWQQVVAASVAMARRGPTASHALASAGLAAAQDGPSRPIDRSVILFGALCGLDGAPEAVQACLEALPTGSVARGYVEARLAAGTVPR
jgi:hypothetical protein